MNEPPVACTDGRVGRGAAGVVVGIVPEDGVAAERAAAEHGRQAPAVERLIRRRTGSREVEDRRRDVGRDHRHVAGRARRGDPRPRHDQGHADAPLVGRSLARAERLHVGKRRLAAVIAGEHDRGAVADAELIEDIEDAAQRVVHALHHRRVGGPPGRHPGLLGGIPRCDRGLRLDRGMDAVVRQVEEERPVAVGRDEGDRLGSLAVGEVFARRAVGERADGVR